MARDRSSARGGAPLGMVVLLVLAAALAGAGAVYLLLGAPGDRPAGPAPGGGGGGEEAPPGWADLYERIRPAVVSIQVFTPDGSEIGSGFLYDDRGRVLTNAHVVAGATEITVVDSEGHRFRARPIGFDPSVDVAMLEVPELAGRAPLSLDAEGTVRPLDPVLVFGSPLGLLGSATDGTVSALGRTLTIDGVQLTNLIQLNAAIASGTSGGPVVDRRGRVVGIAVAHLDPHLAPTISFAIPAPAVAPLAARWAADGRTVDVAVRPAAPGPPPETGPGPDGRPPAKGQGPGRSEPVLVRLAVVMPLTGRDAAIGQEIARGVELAVAEAADRLRDRGVQLESFTVADPEDPRRTARLLGADPSVLAVVGPLGSSEALAMGPVLEQAGVPWVMPVNRNPALSDQGWRTFHRLVAPDAAQAPAAAWWAWERQGARRVLVLHDGSAYGSQLAADFVREFSRLGGEVAAVAAVTGPVGPELISQVHAAAPDALYYGGSPDQAGAVVRSLREAGYRGPLIGPGELKQKVVVEVAGAAAVDVYYTDPVADRIPPEFGVRYLASHGRGPTPWAAYGYDAAQVLIAALEAGLADLPPERVGRQVVLAELKQLRHQGTMGPVAFDVRGENGEAAVHVYQYRGGYPAELVGQVPWKGGADSRKAPPGN